MTQELSEMFAAIVAWASEVKGAENVGKDGNLWIETTEVSEHFPAAVTVTMNATKAELDGIPPFTAMLTNEVYFPGIMALVNPYGGTMVGAGAGDEDRIIQHFNSQVRPQPAAA
jgi:hypothetical protein